MQSSNLNYSKFIKYVSSHTTLPPVETISHELNLPKRSIYSLLQQANNELRIVHQNFLFPNEKIENAQITLLTTKLVDYENDNYIVSAERQLLMDVLITLPSQKWTLAKFQDLFGMSRNTILRDISELKKRNQFKPIFSKKIGFEFHEPLYKRLVHLYDNLNLLQYNSKLLECFFTAQKVKFSESQFFSVSNKLRDIYNNYLSKQISTYDAIALTLFGISSALFDAYFTDEKDKLFPAKDAAKFMIRKEYIVIEKFSQILASNLNATVSMEAKLFLTLQLLSVAKESDAHFNADDFQDLLILSQKITTTVLELSKISATENEIENLIKEIQTQLKPFWYAVNYKSISKYNYLYKDSEFEGYVTKSLDNLDALPLFSHLFPFGLLPEQITILSMIFYNFAQQIKPISSVRILLLSSLPIYSQNLISTILRQNPIPITLSTKNIQGKSEYAPNPHEREFTNFDLIITESAGVNASKPIFLINQILNDSEFDRLKDVVYHLYYEIIDTEK
jgi:transcriptional antiterminator